MSPKIWLFFSNFIGWILKTKGRTCAKASNLTKPTKCQKHLCFHIGYGIPNGVLDVHPEFSWFRGWLCFSCLPRGGHVVWPPMTWVWRRRGFVGSGWQMFLSHESSSASWCDWCLLIRKTLCNLLLACGSIMWFFYILTRSASARKHVMLVCSWFMLGARVVESAAGQLETHGKTHKWTKRQHKILEKWQGGTVLVGMDT